MSVHPSLHVNRRVEDYSHVFRESRETVFTVSRCVDIVIHASGYEDTGPDSIPSSKSKATDPFHTLYQIGHVALASMFLQTSQHSGGVVVNILLSSFSQDYPGTCFRLH